MSKILIPDIRIHIDEAGRGPLAGPVTVGLFISLQYFDTSIFQDSKKLTHRQREEAYIYIQQQEKLGTCIYACGRAENTEIDQRGIITALRIATLRGLAALLTKLYTLYRKEKLLGSVYGEDLLAQTILQQQSQILKKICEGGNEYGVIGQVLSLYQHIYAFKAILLDGNHTFGLDKLLPIKIITIIKGDGKNPLISAASIVAKVERDRRMVEISPAFPGYDFGKNKGYGSTFHREAITTIGLTPLHRRTFLKNIIPAQDEDTEHIQEAYIHPTSNYYSQNNDVLSTSFEKPRLLLHICCAPDLTRPLHWLKDNFKLYLFWYNPNIHPRKEHDQRYGQFLKLVGLEKGDYEILEDWYDPKEFFDAMFEKKDIIHPDLVDADYKTVQQKSGAMEERSDRCNPCYLMRLEQAAKQAALQGIPYFTSTLLISPKKKMDKLFKRGLEAEQKHPGTRFLWFDFIKNEGYTKATQLTKQHDLWRQNYCGCGWTIPKPGDKKTTYTGG